MTLTHTPTHTPTHPPIHTHTHTIEPNNESPLNGDAATLWTNKEAYKKQLLSTYKADAKIPKNN